MATTTTRTHIGYKKEINEDRLLTREDDPDGILLLVTDGLGGHPGGEIAAALVVESIAAQPAIMQQEDLAGLLVTAGETVIRHGASHPDIDGMGTTATLALVQKTQVRWTHLGDGRLYHFHKNKLRCITRDQTLARMLYDQGKISLDEIRDHELNHFLEQCLGEEDPAPDSGSFDWQPGDTLLLNTDGLHDMVTDVTIQTILAEDSSLETKADKLIQEALKAGGKDNITLILCEL